MTLRKGRDWLINAHALSCRFLLIGKLCWPLGRSLPAPYESLFIYFGYKQNFPSVILLSCFIRGSYCFIRIYVCLHFLYFSKSAFSRFKESTYFKTMKAKRNGLLYKLTFSVRAEFSFKTLINWKDLRRISLLCIRKKTHWCFQANCSYCPSSVIDSLRVL